MKKLLIIVLAFIIIVFYFIATHAWQNKELKYSLETNFDKYTNNELSIALFDEIINNFNPDIWDFMTLSANKPINGSTFLQVGAPDEVTDYQYTLEIGFNIWKSGLKMYRIYTEDKDTVLQYFIDYWQEQKIPDISNWEDVTHEMR